MIEVLNRIGHLTRHPDQAAEGELDALAEQVMFSTIPPERKPRAAAALGILTKGKEKKIKNTEVAESNRLERDPEDAHVKAACISRKSREISIQDSIDDHLDNDNGE